MRAKRAVWPVWPWIFVLLVAACSCANLRAAQPVSANSIPQSQLIQPEALHRELRAGLNPLIFQVGSRVLFNESHIAGAEYLGPASAPQGLDALRRRVASLPRSRAIVLYCGCCPWEHCPNIGPAWELLHQMGFMRVKALYLAHNFGSDWVSHGYETQSAQ